MCSLEILTTRKDLAEDSGLTIDMKDLYEDTGRPVNELSMYFARNTT